MIVLKHKLAKSMMLVLSVMFILSGCEQQGPISTEFSEQTQGNVQILKSNSQQPLEKLFANKAMIDDDGGTIVLGDSENGYSYLTFPEDAINEDDYPDGVRIVVYWQSDGLFQVDCYPEGIQFDEPVLIHLSYKSANLISVNENTLDLYYFNPMNNQYESIGGIVNTSEDYVEATINHFSRYAIGYE